MDQCCWIVIWMANVLSFPSPHCPSQVQHTHFGSRFYVHGFWGSSCAVCMFSYWLWWGCGERQDRQVTLGVAANYVKKELPVYLLIPSWGTALTPNPSTYFSVHPPQQCLWFILVLSRENGGDQTRQRISVSNPTKCPCSNLSPNPCQDQWNPSSHICRRLDLGSVCLLCLRKPDTLEVI